MARYYVLVKFFKKKQTILTVYRPEQTHLKAGPGWTVLDLWLQRKGTHTIEMKWQS